jgi:serine/threonine protein kinase
VYKALHLKTGHFAAVKVLNSHSVKLAQIQQEIDILRKLTHPNIIKYLDCSPPSHQGNPYIIFEYVENGSLKDVIGRFGTFPEELTKRYVYQVRL